MMTVFATAGAPLAVFAGVLLAAFDQPRAEADRRTHRMSLVLVAAASLTVVAGGAYAIMA